MAKYYNPRFDSRKNQNSYQKPKPKLERFYNPYTFVKLSAKPCLYPDDECKRILHAQDIPFSDGISGSIDVSFKAESPLCVKGEAENNANVKGRYYIPGSSVKGMIRNVLEILSLSDIATLMSDDRYSFRDLRNDKYELKSCSADQTSGFLFMVNGKYYVKECDNHEMSYDDIYKMTHISFHDLSFADKYNKVKSPIIDYKGKKCFWMFSGKMRNKNHEFLFELPQSFSESSSCILQGDQLKDFLFIHQIENENNNAWKRWGKILKNYSAFSEVGSDGIAPCFFRKVKSDGQIVVRDLGFCKMYRQPYKLKIFDCIPKDYNSSRLDFAKTIFGFTSNKASLKGRVQFMNAFVQNPATSAQQWFVCGAPKPSYYPFYLEQSSRDRLVSYADEKATISGWKRYVVRDRTLLGEFDEKHSKHMASFVPLKAGTCFTTRINFHNLRPYELGALLSAISFHGEKGCFHLLGFAKPFGYGKLSLSNIQLQSNSGETIDGLMEAFERKVTEMSGLSSAQWKETVAPLFRISSTRSSTQVPIRYPHLQDKAKGYENEFVQIKAEKKNIRDLSSDMGN